MSKIARVILESPLPNLDKVFDYGVAEHLVDTIQAGQRVRVPFGRSKKALDGYVIEVVAESSFTGKLSQISEIVSEVAVLPENIYRLISSVASRQASTTGDVLASAVVARSVRVEKKFVDGQPLLQARKSPPSFSVSATLARPTLVTSSHAERATAGWIETILTAAAKNIEAGFSAIVLVPDFRDQALLRSAIENSALSSHYIDFSTEQKGSARYENFLKCLTEGAHLVVGSRSSLYAPLQNLGIIICFDDGDRNFLDQQSPYAHARDIALLRQSEEKCSLLFVSHSRSTEVQRLVDIGYATEQTDPFVAPKLAFDETTARVSTLAWQTIRESTETGVVLVQVGSKGVARTAYCTDCSKRALCTRCNGPIWIDATSTPRCRWCNAQNLAFKCDDCGSAKLRQGSGGATRTITEFGAAFPGLQLVESTGDKPLLTVEGKSKIVVSTPGAEPHATDGYSAVVILDAKQSLNRDSLRASEDAVRQWSNAIAKLAPDGRAVIVGIPSKLGQRLALWQQVEIARDELENRRDLDFPPHLRLGSVEGPIDAISDIVSSVKIKEVQALGPISVLSRTGEEQQRLILKYPYASGHELALTLKAAQLRFTSGMTKTSAAGRVSRAVRVRMDDPEVI
jgi:primosomal protein N' (replication factor Y)